MKWVIETEGLTETEHLKRVNWVEKNLTNAAQEIPGAFVYCVVFDENGKPTRFSGNGEAISEETRELVLELIGEYDDEQPRSA